MHAESFLGEYTPWQAAAHKLARHLHPMLVNRNDAWGGYYVNHLGVQGTVRYATQDQPLDEPLLAQHFGGQLAKHVIGLHAASPDATCRWAAVDLDVHGGRGDADANLQAALYWYGHLRELGFRPWLSASNGSGGYHLRVIWDVPVPMASAHALMASLTTDWASHGLQARPELFPARANLTGKGLGLWLRLPGRHHRREFWSQFLDGDRWLAGADAVQFLLDFQPNRADLVPIVQPVQPQRRPMPRLRTDDDIDRDRAVAMRTLDAIPNDDAEYDDWLRIGMALHSVAGDDEEMLDLWRAWSSQSAKHDDQTCRSKWRSFRADARGGVTLGTLVSLARQHGVNPLVDRQRAGTPSSPRSTRRFIFDGNGHLIATIG